MSANISAFDELEWAPELEWESEATFNFSGVSAEVMRLLQARRESDAVKLAIQGGDTNENHLSDIVFFNRHPERGGRFISRDEADYSRLSQDWLAIRDGIVRPALGSSSAPSPPYTPPSTSPKAPSTSTCKQPVSASTLATWKQRMARVALAEFDRWQRGALTETDAEAIPILTNYWQRGVGLSSSDAASAARGGTYWSAAFICWVVRTAGVTDFRWSGRHGDYIVDAKQNRENGSCRPFWLFRASEAVPEIGDLLCTVYDTSSGAVADYDRVQPVSGYHCDVVVEKTGSYLRVLGGNVSDSVNYKSNIAINSSGRLSGTTYFAIIKVGYSSGGSGGSSPAPGGGGSGTGKGLDLVTLSWAGRTFQVARQIAGKVQGLLEAAAADGIQLTVNSAFRDPSQQIALRKKNCGSSHYDIYDKPSSQCTPPTARPGTSNHEKGLAIDFGVTGGKVERGTAAFDWLSRNAERYYGLKNYPKEPWHWSVDGN